jgi:hypothetical protein
MAIIGRFAGVPRVLGMAMMPRATAALAVVQAGMIGASTHTHTRIDVLCSMGDTATVQCRMCVADVCLCMIGASTALATVQCCTCVANVCLMCC